MTNVQQCIYISKMVVNCHCSFFTSLNLKCCLVMSYMILSNLGWGRIEIKEILPISKKVSKYESVKAKQSNDLSTLFCHKIGRPIIN